MNKSDVQSVFYAASVQASVFTAITNTEIPSAEDYKYYDYTFSAISPNQQIKQYREEVKTMRDEKIKINGEWNPTFLGKIHFECRDLTGGTIGGKYVWMINADRKNDDDITHSKGYKILHDPHCYFCIVAPDGLLLFNNKQLNDAIIAIGYYHSFSHTTDRGEGKNPMWERKYFFDITKGTYIPRNVPKEILTK